jgi:hypothetical protein
VMVLTQVVVVVFLVYAESNSRYQSSFHKSYISLFICKVFI